MATTKTKKQKQKIRQRDRSVLPHSAICFGTVTAQQLRFFFFLLLTNADSGKQHVGTADTTCWAGECVSHHPTWQAKSRAKESEDKRDTEEGGWESVLSKFNMAFPIFDLGNSGLSRVWNQEENFKIRCH